MLSSSSGKFSIPGEPFASRIRADKCWAVANVISNRWSEPSDAKETGFQNLDFQL